MLVKIKSRLIKRNLKNNESVYHPVLGVGLASVPHSDMAWAISNDAFFKRDCDVVRLSDQGLRVQELREIYVVDDQAEEPYAVRLDTIFWRLAHKAALVDSGKQVRAYMIDGSDGAILLPMEEVSDGR